MRKTSKQASPLILFLWVQVDRSKKPSAKIPEDHKVKVEIPAVVKPLNSNGKLVPDRSRKPPLDTKPNLTDEERSSGHLRKTTAVEKNEGDEEVEEQREVQRQERAEETAKDDHGDWEGRENRQRYQEDQERKEKEEPGKGVERKQSEKVPRDSADLKKKSIAGNESPEMKKADVDKSTASEKEKNIWTPETQRHRFAEEPQGPLRGDSGLNKVSDPAATWRRGRGARRPLCFSSPVWEQWREALQR